MKELKKKHPKSHMEHISSFNNMVSPVVEAVKVLVAKLDQGAQTLVPNYATPKDPKAKARGKESERRGKTRGKEIEDKAKTRGEGSEVRAKTKQNEEPSLARIVGEGSGAAVAPLLASESV